MRSKLAFRSWLLVRPKSRAVRSQSSLADFLLLFVLPQIVSNDSSPTSLLREKLLPSLRLNLLWFVAFSLFPSLSLKSLSSRFSFLLRLQGAAFNPSVFGSTLTQTLQIQSELYPDDRVPIILPFLANGILALGGAATEGIFRVPGDGDGVAMLKDRIDRGQYQLSGVDDPNIPASLFKLWLRELQEPLIPPNKVSLRRVFLSLPSSANQS